MSFDADVLSGILLGDAALQARLAAIPPDQVAVPIVVAEEILRGRLNTIRQSQAGRGRVVLERAYDLLLETLLRLQPYRLLTYTSQADLLFDDWRQQKFGSERGTFASPQLRSRTGPN